MVLSLTVGGSLLFAQVADEGDSGEIEEIVVSAPKREESLQDLPLAVAVFDGEALNNEGIDSLVDLDAQAPGVSILKNEGFSTVISMRGVGLEANQNETARPSVSLHQDGIPIGSMFVLASDLVDLERIEIVRGPQSTALGQNSSGGAINIVTRRPSAEGHSGRFTLTKGNYNRTQASGSLNLSLSESVAVRMSSATNRHDGFSKNLLLNQELDDADSWTGRIRVLWTLNPNVDLDLNLQTFREDRNGAAQKGVLDTLADPRELSQDSPSSYLLEAKLGSWTFSWSRPAFEFKYLGSTQHARIDVSRDNDRTSLVQLGMMGPTPALLTPEIRDQDTQTHEFQFISDRTAFPNLDWLVGFYFFNAEINQIFHELIDFGWDGQFDPVSVEDVLSFALGDYGFISDSDFDRYASSAYAHINRPITTNTVLNVGLRYTKDSAKAAVTNFYGRAGTADLNIDSKRVTGRVGLEYHADTNSMWYVSLTRGFKPGGTNLTYGREDVIAPRLVQPTFENEVVDAVEVGMKSFWFDQRMRSNLALFIYDYQNLQYQATDPEVFEGGVANVPRSSIMGVEWEALFYASDALQFEIGIGLLNTEITESHLVLDNWESDRVTNQLLSQGYFLFGPDIQRARAEKIQDVKGNQLAKTPKLNSSFALKQLTDWGDLGTVRTTFRLVSRGSYYYRLFNNPVIDDVDAYTVFNVSSALRFHDKSWFVNVAVLNVFDVDGVNARFTDVFGVGSTSDELIAPRQLQLRFGMEFN